MSSQSLKTPNQVIIENIQAELKLRQEKELLTPEFLSEHGEEYVKLKEAELQLRRGLPHLYGFKWYPWARDFFESRRKINFLVAANQISKSSSQIRKCIDWATDESKWHILWPHRKPRQFVYFYPTSNQASIEFESKWVPEFLPRAEYKKHPQYGWTEEWKNKEIFAVYFNSGIHVYFKTYKQGSEALQTITADAIWLDEECPEALWDEISFRVAATNGYIHMVFTATLGQELWRQTMEPVSKEEERFKDAWKRQVSMYDCQRYEDGTPSHWTPERIQQIIATCKSPQEVQRRVFGRFVVDSGLKYGEFDIKRHLKPAHPVPKAWNVYAAVDIGSGGETGHPSAISFIAVDPTYRQGRVIGCWRGDGTRTTAADVYVKYKEMEQELKVSPVLKIYDWASTEFGAISDRNGEGFVRADKSHEKGEQAVNVLFKNDMLFIYQVGDYVKLATELSSVTVKGAKRSKLDDLSDTIRYICVLVPWDWTAVMGAPPELLEQKKVPLNNNQIEIMERRKAFEEGKREEDRVEDEFEEWNSLY